MGMLANLIKQYFDTEDLNYRESVDNDGDVCLRLSFSAKNKPSVEVLLILDEEQKTLSLRSFDFCSVTEDKKQGIYKLCSDMNHKFKWVKFYLDENDNTVTLEDDAILAPENAGAEAMELMLRMVAIADTAYPFFMKYLWA